MKFTETKLKGAFVIECDKYHDDRGYFARAWDKKEFSANGLDANWVLMNMSQNIKSGTVRGMHYQDAPYPENKLVRCVKGALYDVIIDLRKESPTYLESFSVVLTQDNGKMLFIPEYFAHGFQTMCDNTFILYSVSAYWHQELYRGINYNDPCIDIIWPYKITAISKQDQSWPTFK